MSQIRYYTTGLAMLFLAGWMDGWCGIITKILFNEKNLMYHIFLIKKYI